MKITLPWKPESTNHLYKHTCRWRFPTVYMTKKWKDLKETYKMCAYSQFLWYDKFMWDIETYIKIYFDSHRKHDIDNYSKILLDSLSWIVWEDDNQIQKQTVEKFYDKEKPRIEIKIKEYIND